MRIEDFGFTPVMGEEYVITFTSGGELLHTSIYNGAPLPAIAFPDNGKVSLSITDKETGKNVMSSEFIHYNGKLYKTVFNLPLQNPESNKNANVYIKDLHYDLTTGSVLVQVQGFSGDNYKLSVSDSTLKHKVVAMPITLQDDMYYSIPTELVQGGKFEVLLQDEHGKSIDAQEFTAPISTDWRHSITLEEGNLEMDPEVPVPETPEIPQPTIETPPVDQLGTQAGQLVEETGIDKFIPDNLAEYRKPIMLGGLGLFILITLIILIRMSKKRKAKKAWENLNKEEVNSDDFEDAELQMAAGVEDDFEEVDGEEETEDKGKRR